MGHRTFMEAGKIKGNEILITTNHIFTGGVHIIAGRIGGPFGSGLPITIRLELSSPGLIIRPPVQYNPMITFHGIFMTLFILSNHSFSSSAPSLFAGPLINNTYSRY